MLTNIYGKTYGFFNRFKPEYQNLEKLIGLCENGTSQEVLEQITTSGFDNVLLKCPFLIKENSPMPVHPTKHPFTAACQKQNYPVVRLLLELGMDVDVPWNYNSQHMTLRQQHEDNAMLMELFEGGKHWWAIEYPDAKKNELQNDLERHVLNGNAGEVAWLMTHGVRLASPEVLANASFEKQPQAFKELVCRMGIPENSLTDFQAWLKNNAPETDVLQILDAMPHDQLDEGYEITEKLLLTINLLREDILDALADKTFSIPVRIGLLKGLIEAYDTSEHKEFIEKRIAGLFREILCEAFSITHCSK